MNKNFGCLYIISTPIGNLNDITLRAIETLHKVDVCACEDTRTSRILFDKYSIKTKLISYHKFSEKSKTQLFIKKLKEGKNIALISDAGTPMISDPGKYLVSEALENNITISPIPGATSVIAALSVSGFSLENFTFYGFFPRKIKEQNLIIDQIKNSSFVSVLFESGKRLEKLLELLSSKLTDNQKIFVAREMTKIHETFYKGKVNEVKKLIAESSHGLKGEFVVVLDRSKEKNVEVSKEDMRIMNILYENLDSKLAMKLGTKILGMKRNQIYKSYIED